jgi:hypothetical protein
MPWPVATTVSGEIDPKQQALNTTASVPRQIAWRVGADAGGAWPEISLRAAFRAA